MRLIRALLLVVVLPAISFAQGTGPSPWLKDIFKSSKLGADRTIYVATPANYGTSAQRYPVLVLLDADDQPQFTAAVANVAFLASRGAIPDMLVVGVANGNDRTHDLTPAATGA